jgi:hypothetical protein
VQVPGIALRQKLRLARRLAHLVVAYVHWGSELLDWPNADQHRAARWLVDQGVDLIVGHHPHVVQLFECLRGKPVFFSLGNHLFDQKYPATKEGIIADCRIADNRLTCGAMATRTPAGSSFPQLPAGTGEVDKTVLDAACTPTLAKGLTVAGHTLRPIPTAQAGAGSDAEYSLEAVKDGKVQWKTRPVRLLAIDTGYLAGLDGPEMLFTLERHGSPLDHEDSPRPYVYEVTSQGLLARWRGTALAWPLLDAALLPGEAGVLCALHRGDSYLTPDPRTPRTRIAAYRWNGFGFSGIHTAETLSRCADLLDLPVAHKEDR